MILEVENLSVKVGDFVVEDFSMEIAEGECVALMGPSGCGKTTVVEAICGLRCGVIGGRIMIDGTDLVGVEPGGRGVGFVPQDVVLFPTLTVRENLEFAPKIRRWRRRRIKERVEELAVDLGLTELLDRMAGALSGGEARRVALGRALAVRPRLLCLDEALAGLDAERHQEVLQVVRKMIEKEKVTVLHITHSREEAEALADRVVLME